jgi:hypothetical protein
MGPLLNEATGGGVDVQGSRPGPLHSPDDCDPSLRNPPARVSASPGWDHMLLFMASESYLPRGSIFRTGVRPDERMRKVD